MSIATVPPHPHVSAFLAQYGNVLFVHSNPSISPLCAEIMQRYQQLLMELQVSVYDCATIARPYWLMVVPLYIDTDGQFLLGQDVCTWLTTAMAIQSQNHLSYSPDNNQQRTIQNEAPDDVNSNDDDMEQVVVLGKGCGAAFQNALNRGGVIHKDVGTSASSASNTAIGCSSRSTLTSSSSGTLGNHASMDLNGIPAQISKEELRTKKTTDLDNKRLEQILAKRRQGLPLQRR